MKFSLRRPRDLARQLRLAARRDPDQVEDYLDENHETWAAIAEHTPGDAADILEALSDEAAGELFVDLDEEQAAGVLEELRDDLAADFLVVMEPETAARVVEEMAPEEAVDILERLDPDEREPILRAAESKAEFFAVASEAFFESPRETRRRYPAVYEQLKGFYRQDPARP